MGQGVRRVECSSGVNPGAQANPARGEPAKREAAGLVSWVWCLGVGMLVLMVLLAISGQTFPLGS